MNTLSIIKSKIQELYQKNPNIHINVSIAKPRIILKNEPVVIKGVYPHIFQIEEQSGDTVKCHTLQYADILTKNIQILEIGRPVVTIFDKNSGKRKILLPLFFIRKGRTAPPETDHIRFLN